MATVPPDQKKKVIIVLEKASLEAVKTKRGYEMLNCDEHKVLHKKMKRGHSAARSRLALRADASLLAPCTALLQTSSSLGQTFVTRSGLALPRGRPARP